MIRLIAWNRRLSGVVAIVILAALLIVSVAGVARSVLAAREVEESPSIAYRQSGEFDYSARIAPSTLYGDRTDDGGPEPDALAPDSADGETYVFMREIIDEFDMYYSSALVASEPLSWQETTVDTYIYVENPDYWRKEAQHYTQTSGSPGFELWFPLDAGALETEVEQVDTDVGFETSSIELQIESVVRVQGATTGGVSFDEEFRHALDGVLTEHTLELTGSLYSPEKRSVGRLILEHEGRFDYAVWLKYNDLYDEQVLRSEPLPEVEGEEDEEAVEGPSVVVGPGTALFPNLLEELEMRFYYTFDSETPVQDERHDVSLLAVLENPEVWSKEFPLLQDTRSGDFGLTLAVPIPEYMDTIESIERETAVVSNEYTLTFVAKVDTTAETELGPIREAYTQSLVGRLSGNTLVFGEELSQSLEGEVGGEEVPAHPESAGWLTPWWFGVACGGLGLAMVLRPGLLGGGDRRNAEERRFLKDLGRYRDHVLDVSSAPEADTAKTVFPVRSIEQLGRVSEVVMKPMVHVSANGSHRLFVLDGDVRYEYVPGDEA